MNQGDDNHIRFIAKSAQEAAAIVRERLGPQGRVISVEQIMGSGLKRFISAPRLEIVAKKIPPPDPPSNAVAMTANKADIRPPIALASSEPSLTNKTRVSFNCRSLLVKAGFSPRLMARLEGAERWREISEMTAEEGLPQAIAWLRQYRSKPNALPMNAKVAFIGFSGTGKTTALCKYLAREIFLFERTPEVLQLEVDKPHMDSGLSIYCDILGVPCFEDPARINGSGTVLIDVPGFPSSAKTELSHLDHALEAIGADYRFLVLNAAYENSILNKQSEVGLSLGATHRIYTHLDELDNVSKLWAGILDPACPALFFSTGQNVVGNIVEDCFGYLLERTFPP